MQTHVPELTPNLFTEHPRLYCCSMTVASPMYLFFTPFPHLKFDYFSRRLNRAGSKQKPSVLVPSTAKVKTSSLSGEWVGGTLRSLLLKVSNVHELSNMIIFSTLCCNDLPCSCNSMQQYSQDVAALQMLLFMQNGRVSLSALTLPDCQNTTIEQLILSISNSHLPTTPDIFTPCHCCPFNFTATSPVP